MTQTVIGLFDNETEAQQAVQQLVTSGISRENIDVSTRNSSSTQNSSSNQTGIMGGSTINDSSFNDSSMNSKSMSGSNSMTNDSTSGEARSMSTDYNDGKKETGIGKFFRSLFGSNDEADTYSSVANRSGSIVTVHAQSSDQAQEAADILDDCGAIDVNDRATQYGYMNESNSTTNGGTTSMKEDQTSTSLNVIKEEMQVGKRTVETGGKRLRSRIIERPVEESLRLREENVRVERNTVDRPATAADLDNFKEGEFEMVERAEVPVVSKEARVVEEVILGKEVNERKETIRDTVRSTEVEVEDIESNKKKDPFSK